VSAVKEEQFKILKTMTEATSKIDLHVLSETVNLTPNQTIAEVQALADEGFMARVGHGYGVTEKGKAALKARTPVPEENIFVFYNNLSQATGFSAKSIIEFYKDIQQVNAEALEFHLYREDFENWLRDVIKDVDMAEELGKIRFAGLQGEQLRAKLVKALDLKYFLEA
jgi:predicted transcriptional regulator